MSLAWSSYRDLSRLQLILTHTHKVEKSLWSYSTPYAIATKTNKKIHKKPTRKQNNPNPFVLKRETTQKPLYTSLILIKPLMPTQLSHARGSSEFMLQRFSKESSEPTSILFLSWEGQKEEIANSESKPFSRITSTEVLITSLHSFSLSAYSGTQGGITICMGLGGKSRGCEKEVFGGHITRARLCVQGWNISCFSASKLF